MFVDAIILSVVLSVCIRIIVDINKMSTRYSDSKITAGINYMYNPYPRQDTVISVWMEKDLYNPDSL